MHIWAEVGSCDGDMEYALDAANAIARSGAAAMKVQWLTPDLIFHPDAVRYDNTSGDWITQTDGYPKTLSYMEWAQVAEHCEKLGIGFIPAVFDTTAILTAQTLGLPEIKIASGDITNENLIRTAAKGNFRRITISTGGATEEEVNTALMWIIEENDTMAITLLACHLEYPTPITSAHLGRILLLRNRFPKLDVGYSDHTAGLDTIPLALVLGAQVLEKHFTLHPGVGGGDHDFAVNPEQLADAVRLAQYTLTTVGDIEMVPSPGEQAALTGARRSLYAARDMKAGTKVTESDLVALRPVVSDAFPASEWTKIIGQNVVVDIPKGGPIFTVAVGGVSASLTVA